VIFDPHFNQPGQVLCILLQHNPEASIWFTNTGGHWSGFENREGVVGPKSSTDGGT